jgi:hypothetical protein
LAVAQKSELERRSYTIKNAFEFLLRRTMLASTRQSTRLTSSVLSRAGPSSLQPVNPFSHSALRTFSHTATSAAATDSSASSSSTPPPTASSSTAATDGSGRTKRRHWLPYSWGFLRRKNEMNPSPLTAYPLPEDIIATKGPKQDGSYALRQPITHDFGVYTSPAFTAVSLLKFLRLLQSRLLGTTGLSGETPGG